MPKAKKEKIEEQLEEMPLVTKNEVIQGTDFYKAIKKYEGKESFNPWPIIIVIAAAIILAVIFIF